MRNLLLTKTNILILLAVVLSCFHAYSKEKNEEVSIHSLTLKQNVNQPSVPSKLRDAVRSYMKKEALALIKMGYTVETERNGEVIVVSIPVSGLFEPNDTVLLQGGERKLVPLLSYLKSEGRFKMILAMHCDNTGSEQYKEELSAKRLQQVEDFIEQHAHFPNQIVAYSMADNDPLVPNTTRGNRERNRRLEVYIVPFSELISKIR